MFSILNTKQILLLNLEIVNHTLVGSLREEKPTPLTGGLTAGGIRSQNEFGQDFPELLLRIAEGEV